MHYKVPGTTYQNTTKYKATKIHCPCSTCRTRSGRGQRTAKPFIRLWHLQPTTQDTNTHPTHQTPLALNQPTTKSTICPTMKKSSTSYCGQSTNHPSDQTRPMSQRANPSIARACSSRPRTHPPPSAKASETKNALPIRFPRAEI